MCVLAFPCHIPPSRLQFPIAGKPGLVRAREILIAMTWQDRYLQAQ